MPPTCERPCCRAGVWDQAEEGTVSASFAAASARPRSGTGSAATPPTWTASTGGDHWNAQRLGVPALRGRQAARFDAITQDWLRDPVKRWSRFRLATGCAFTTITAGALALSRFSAFLAERHPGIAGEAGITRPVLEDYLSWLLAQGYSASTRALSLSDAPGVLRRLPPPRLAAGTVPQRRPSTPKSSPTTTTR
jgi:hypothetical protein